MKGKKIIVISGVTGAIGSALFSEYAQKDNTIVYGISRRALPISSFLKEGKLPLKTLICSIGENGGYNELFKNIRYEVGEVSYIHAIGLYPFEVSSNGNIIVENDLDNDGINDEVTKLTYELFISATESLQKYWKGRSKCVIFGGIADKHQQIVHGSWWRTIERVKVYMKGQIQNNENLSMIVFNISSVLCPHEIITRPFVFTSTDAEQAYWLHPYDLSRFVEKEIKSKGVGFFELEKFNIKPGFDPDTYYTDSRFTPRKVREIYLNRD